MPVDSNDNTKQGKPVVQAGGGINPPIGDDATLPSAPPSATQSVFESSQPWPVAQAFNKQVLPQPPVVSVPNSQNMQNPSFTGASVAEETKTNLYQEGMVAPQKEEAVLPQDQKTTQESEKSETKIPKKGNLKKILLIVASLILVGILGFIAYRMFFLKTKQAEKITLNWWSLWEDESIVAPLIASYQESHPNVTINYTRQSQTDYRERLTNSLAKGEGPDIFRFHNTWGPMFKNELDNVPPSFMSASDYSQTYFPVAVSDMTSGTGLVGVPLGYEALTLYVNEDLFAAEGVTPPVNWDDLRDLAKRFTKTENGQIVQSGVALGRTENVDNWQEILALMMLQNGADLNKPTGILAEDALKFYTLFANVDKVWNETLPNSTLFFASGNLAMYFGPSWRYFEIKGLNPDLNFRTVPVPQLPKQTSFEPDIAYATYWAEGVWERSVNKDAAWDFLKYLSEKQNLEVLYKNASATRGFGEAYPRVDQKELLADHEILGSIIALADKAQSWYLASRTFDGPTGINSLISSYFEDAVNAVNAGTDPKNALETASLGVGQVLTQYGLFK